MILNELAQFHQFVGAQIQSGNTLSPEEALDLWRDQHPDIAGEDATDDIGDALSDLAAGDSGISFDEFSREFRRRNQIS
jgi:hypothetical protein